MEISVAPLRGSSGEVLGGIEIFRDMSGMLNDLNRAKAIQDNALQSTVPPDPRVCFEVHYQPAELVGGDFYRVEQLTPDTYLVFIADVMGHGVASALYTMHLRSMCEECRDSLGSPGRFLTMLGQRLHTLASREGYFATAFCGVLDLLAGRLRYVRAAHPAPFLFRCGRPLERLSAKSAALGLHGSVMFEETTVGLNRGDSVVLFTDGAVEISGKNDELLGEEALERILCEKPDLELHEVEKQLLKTSSLIRLPDDLTLIRFRLL